MLHLAPYRSILVAHTNEEASVDVSVFIDTPSDDPTPTPTPTPDPTPSQPQQSEADRQAQEAANNGTIDYSLPKVSIKAPKKAKKGFTAKWKKLSKKNQKKIKGIEFEYSTTNDFSSGNVFRTAGKKSTSKAVKKLKAKTTYYVRAHTYVIRNGVKYVSDWSIPKKVKTK